jgi:hypothetical protein
MTMKMTAKFVERYPISPVEYWELEGSIKEPKQASLIGRMWQALVAKLSSSTDPHIRLKYSPSGQEYWHVYDPMSGKAQTFTAEADVRVWLEERYSH